MNINVLRKTKLFSGMTEEEIAAALPVLKAAEKEYQKGALILRAGSTTDRMGLVLQGSVTIENNDIWGNRTLLSRVDRNQFFAETYALLKGEPLLVDVVANENCRILFLRVGGIAPDTPWSIKLMANLLAITARKNLILSGRSFHTAPHTIRGKVLAYLNSVAIREHATEFDIPLDRQQMADYLNVDRTALSKELGRMQEEGLIRFRRNHFTLMGEGIE